MTTSHLVAAVDLGGTRCKAAAVRLDAEREPCVERRLPPVPVAGLDADAALDAVVRQVEPLARSGATHLALAVPGLHRDGTVLALPGKFPGLEGRDVVAEVRDATGLRCHLVNDAVAYGVGEARAGAGRGHDTVVVVTIGTGVGTTVLVAGRPVGRGPLAGGLLGGQVPISDPTGPTDTAGRRGTFEARCRAPRLLEGAREAGSDASTVEDVLRLAADGAPAAVAGVRQWQEWLVRGLVALAHAHGADALVVGGGPVGDVTSRAGSPLLDGVEEAVRRATWPGFDPVVVAAALGDDAGPVGAALLADEVLGGRP